MSYGVNAPWGLQAIRTITDATWSGKTDTYLIASGYNQNIFKGDLVYITTTGYIQNAIDYDNHGTSPHAPSVPLLGVFDGCMFQQPTAANPTDPANPGRQYWPAGTQTLGGVPAVAYIITDPNVVYNAQVTGTRGAAQADVGCSIKAVYQVQSDIVQGNTQTGQSYMSLDIASVERQNADLNCFILSLSQNPQNLQPITVAQAGASIYLYNNVEVLLQNSYFRQMPASGAAA